MKRNTLINRALTLALSVTLITTLSVPTITAFGADPTGEPTPTPTGELSGDPTDNPSNTPSPAAQFEALVESLPAPTEVTPGDTEAVDAALAAYEALSAEDQALVAESYQALEAVVRALEALSPVVPVSKNGLESNEAQIDSQEYPTLAEAVAQASPGDTIVLKRTISLSETLVINKALTIDGAGYSVTGTGLSPAISVETDNAVILSDVTISDAVHGIHLTSAAAQLELTDCTINVSERGVSLPLNKYEGVNLVLNGTAINNNQVSNYDTEVIYNQSCRGISLWNITNSSVKIMNGSSINGFSYCINVDGVKSDRGVIDTSGLDVLVDGSTLRGWTGLNVWGSLATYTFKNSHVKGVNTSNGTSNSFAALVLNGDIYNQFGQAHAENNILNIEGSTITNFQSGSCIEALLRIDCGIASLNLSGTVNFIDTTGNIDAALYLNQMADPISFLRDKVYTTSATINSTTLGGAPLPFAPDYKAHYYWPGGGCYCVSLTDIFKGDGYTLCAGESIDLIKDATLDEDVTASLKEGAGLFTLNLKGYSISGGHTIALPAGISVLTDTRQTELFVPSTGCILSETDHGNGTFTYTSTAIEGIAAIGSQGYASLAAALEAVPSNGTEATTVTLLANAAENVSVAQDKNVVLDLNGFTLNGGTGSSKATLLNHGTVLIRDTSLAGTGTIKRDDVGIEGETSYYVLNNQGTMTIESGKIENNSGYKKSNPSGSYVGASLICNADGDTPATLNIKGGTLTQKNFIVVKNGSWGTVNMSGGTITSDQSTIQNWNITNITGGELNGILWTDIYDESALGQTTISGTAKVTGKILTHWTGSAGVPTVIIEDGVFDVVWENKGTHGFAIKVTGGTFSSLLDTAYYDTSKYKQNALDAAAEPGKVVPLVVTPPAPGPGTDPEPEPEKPIIKVEVPPTPDEGHYVTIPQETIDKATENAQNVLDTIAAGEVPAGMSEEQANEIAGVLDKAQSPEEVEVVLSLQAEPKAAHEVDSTEREAVEGASGEGEEPTVFFDLSVLMTIKVKGGGDARETTVKLSAVDKPLLFEIHVDPELIRGKNVRIAHVHDGITEVYNPESVDREAGIVRLHAAKFSTYALLTSTSCTVSFESNGGSSVKEQGIPFGGTVVRPADPTRDGFVFAGWFTDEALTAAYDFAKPVDKSFVLYAKWTPVTNEPGQDPSGTPGGQNPNQTPGGNTNQPTRLDTPGGTKDSPLARLLSTGEGPAATFALVAAMAALVSALVVASALRRRRTH